VSESVSHCQCDVTVSVCELDSISVNQSVSQRISQSVSELVSQSVSLTVIE